MTFPYYLSTLSPNNSLPGMAAPNSKLPSTCLPNKTTLNSFPSIILMTMNPQYRILFRVIMSMRLWPFVHLTKNPQVTRILTPVPGWKLSINWPKGKRNRRMKPSNICSIKNLLLPIKMSRKLPTLPLNGTKKLSTIQKRSTFSNRVLSEKF